MAKAIIPAKQCFECLLVLPLTDFYAHRLTKDGHVGKCKECTKRHVREYRAAKWEYYKEYEHFRGQTTKRRKQAAEAQLKRRSRYPEKYKAWTAVGNAISGGKISRLPCEVCGKKESQAHHEDYSKPLDVRWLCRTHHLMEHGHLAYLCQGQSAPELAN